ncbi:DUF2169 domain-containing protein [Sorangium sp. So ce429]
MLTSNITPFAALGFEQKHRDGDAMAVVAARGTLLLSPEGRLSIAPDQPLILADEYEGDPHATPMLRVGLLIPFKPAADVTLLAEGHAPGGEPAHVWQVGARVGETTRFLRAHAPRAFEPDAGGFRLSRGEPAARASIDYRSAAGGVVIGDPEGNVDARNPIGRGVLDGRHTPADRAYPAPTLDSETEPVGDPAARPEPQGFGPVPPWWQFRSRFAGTYDDAWLATRHPQLPADFDYRFYQTAHPGLVLPGHLRGDERVELQGLTPGGGALAFTLPGRALWAWFTWERGRRVPVRLHLDGLHIDVRGEPPWSVQLTWRAWVAMSQGFDRIELAAASLEEAAALPWCDERGLVSPGSDA